MTIDITPEAIEKLAANLDSFVNSSSPRFVSCNEAVALRALSAALERSQAETAAAYEYGRADGMREAARIANTLLVRSTFGTTDRTVVTYSDFVAAIILSAIPKGKDHE